MEQDDFIICCCGCFWPISETLLCFKFASTVGTGGEQKNANYLIKFHLVFPKKSKSRRNTIFFQDVQQKVFRTWIHTECGGPQSLNKLQLLSLFVWKTFHFPEILIALKGWRMPNNATFWHQKVIFWNIFWGNCLPQKRNRVTEPHNPQDCYAQLAMLVCDGRKAKVPQQKRIVKLEQLSALFKSKRSHPPHQRIQPQKWRDLSLFYQCENTRQTVFDCLSFSLPGGLSKNLVFPLSLIINVRDNYRPD